MKNVSNAYKKVIEQGGPFYLRAKVTLADSTILDLTPERDFQIDGNGIVQNGGSGFPLGVAVSKTLTIALDNSDDRYSNYDFVNARITPKTEAYTEDGTEWIQEEIFTVLDPVEIGDTIELTAYDDMYKADRSFVSKLDYPTTAKQLLLEVCDVCDIPVGSPTFKNETYQIQTKPEGKTARQIIGYIAQIACGNAVMQNGMLFIRSYDFGAFQAVTDGTREPELQDNAGYYIISDYPLEPNISTDNITITGISTKIRRENGDVIIVRGSDEYCLEIENPLIEGNEETALALIGTVLIGTTICKFSGSFFSDPTMEFMDLVCLVDMKDHVRRSFLSNVEFVYLNQSNLSCDLETPAQRQAQYNSNATTIYQNVKRDLQQNKTEWETAVDNLRTTLENASGMYQTEVVQDDGSIVTYIHDKKTLSQSKNVIKVTSEAIGLSSDGGKTFPYGLYLTGDLIARILYTIGINADYINTGAFTVKDTEGNINFQADTQTGKVIISGNSVMIGGKTATDAINSANSTASNALTAAQNARNMALQLSNDYYSVNVDSNGKYSKFPTDVTTKAQVMYGANDITSECAFTITKSDNISGTWDSAKHQYTVTALTADTGWVNIQAKYLSKLTVTKQFTVAKLYAGANGLNGKDGVDGKDGATGAKGEPGTAGVNGKSIGSVINYYLATSASSGVTTSTSGWTTTVQNVTLEKKYLWNYEVVKYSDETVASTTSPCIIGTYGDTGKTGATGPAGKGIKSIIEQYYKSTSATSLSGGSWSNTYPGWENGKYIWTRSVTTYSDNTTSTTTAMCATGSDGKDGINGTNLWINPLFESDKPQIGTRDTSIKAPNGSAVNLIDKRDNYNSSANFPVFPGHSYRITVHRKKKSGSVNLKAGIWYIAQTSGHSFDTYVDASSTKNLSDGWQEAVYNITCPNGKSKGCVFLQLEKTSTTDTDAAWYVANIICTDITGLKGDKGETGASGKDGTNGKDGVSPTVSVSKSGNTTTISITDKTGTHTQTVKDGTNGTPGKDGTNGKTTYFHVKYSNDGGKTFTANSGETVGSYIGTCTDYTEADPTTVGAYTWAKIKGEPGNTGATGATGNGISEIKEHYAVSASNTTAPTTWYDAAQTTTATKKYLWNYETITYTNGTSVDTKKRVIGVYGDKGATGEKGTPGRTYFIELSSRVLKRSKDNTIAPNFFTIKGFYRDGNSTTRVAYKGRFTIEETNDGNTWKRVYTSSADESSVTHSLYTAIATGSGTNSVVGDGKGNAIGFPRDTIAVRCTMYASGGTTTTLDVQDCAILVDVDALTQEDVFDALTDNGATKGVYKEGNQLYINATYMQIGKIASKNKRVYFDLDNNELACSKMIDRSNEAHTIDGVKYENLQLNMQEINASNTKTYGILMSKEGKEDIGMLFTPSASEDKCNQIRFGKGILIGENSTFASIQIKNYAFGTNNTKVYDDDVTIHGSNKNACWFEIGYDRIGMFENAGPSITINKQKNVWNIPNYKPRNPVEIHGNTYLSSNLVVSGTKNRCVDTDNYGTKLQYCYEMSSPYFGDIGSGVLDETGECYVNIDNIFSETICLNFEYHVFLQKEGSGDIWVEEKQNMFFVVKGTPGLKFSWEIKAKQKDYETERLEDKDGYPTIVDSDYENDGFEEIENYIKSQEEYTL
jgi:hypothetical protein